MYHVPLVVQFIYRWSDEGGKYGDGKEGSEILEDGREWTLAGLLYADDLVLCGESEEELRAMVCRRR